MKIERDGARNDKQAPGTVARLLLSHHPPEHLHRTLRLRVRGCGTVHLCARCCGVLTGLLSGTLLFALGPPWLLPASRVASIAVLLLCAVPAIMDFQRQILRGKESNNARRLTTGGLFGLALSLAVEWAFSGNGWPLAAFVLTFVFWGAWFFRNPVRAHKVVEHLARYAEYFELCRLRDLQNRRRRFLDKLNTSLIARPSALDTRPSSLIAQKGGSLR